MAIFAQHRARPRRSARRLVGALLALATASGLASLPARADTNGGIDSVIPAVPNPLPGAQSTTPALWGWIGNEHILVSQGYINTLTGGGLTLTVAGRISFGTTGGSRASSADNNQPLNGHNYFPSGALSVWPYASSWFGQIGLLVSLDYPAYLQAIVDGTTYNVGYDSAKAVSPPFFDRTSDGPVLSSGYTIGANDEIQVDTRIKLLRSTARIEWRITNNDTLSHNVGLRWTVNQRSTENGLYFVDPEVGASRQTTIYDGSRVPTSLEVYGRRAEESLNDATKPPFHSRHIFRGNGATEPTRVYVGNSTDLYPGETVTPTDQYLPAVNRTPRFDSGLAVAAYYGGDTGYVVRPGETRVVVTYYGLGTSSEVFGNDLVLGTEAPVSLQYNAAAANDPEVLGNTSATLATVGPKFLTPNPFQVFASAYSQKPDDPQFDVPFRGVSLSLTLPNGLRFGMPPGSTNPDIPTKVVSTASGNGNISGDREGSAAWWVEPTGQRFGPVTYQVSLSVTNPVSISRTVSRTINIPNIPLIELLPGKFQMIGFPFVFHPLITNNGDPDTIVNSLSRPEELNPIFYRWVPDSNSFDGSTGRWQVSNKLETGPAYFYRPSITTGNGKRLIFLKGAQPTPTQAPVDGTTSLPTQLTLERGWNMISNPYVYDVPLRYIRVVALENNPNLTSVGFTTAVQTGLLRSSVFFFNPNSGGYDFFVDLNQVIRPWQGYWIYSNTKAEIQFPTPSLRNSLIVQSTTPAPDLPSDAQLEPPTRLTATADNWKLQLVAQREDGKVDAATYIGVASGARPESDVPKPPPFRDYIQVGILDAKGQGRYAQALRTPTGTKSWDLAIESDTDGSATLRWPAIVSLPKRVRLSITDLQTNTRVDMRSAATLRVALRKGGVSRYRVTATTEATRKLAVSYLRAEPGSRSTGVYAYRLGVTQEATVDARIVTLSGRVINVLASGRSATSEGTRLVWNGRNTDGGPVPAGPYNLEVTVTGPDGASVRELRTVTVVR